MAEPIKTCPIWGTRFEAKGTYDPETKTYEVEESARTFAGYSITTAMLDIFVKPMSDSEKARLTTWLIDQSCRGNYQPQITLGAYQDLRSKQPLPVHARADRLLRLVSLCTRSRQLGEFVSFQRLWNDMLAWSESTNQHDVRYLLDYLEKKGWLERDPFGPEIGQNVNWRVSVEGHTRVDELQREENAFDSSQAFIAMWFHESTAEASEKGIETAIVETGYKPLRIDRKEHINKIDDEIIAEIRRSRFLVADFTQGKDGARGGVYYEAGFAHGLGIPVIFTCREDAVETLHFDTNHYNHIVWNTPEELRESLKNRILAVIGEGPDPHGIHDNLAVEAAALEWLGTLGWQGEPSKDDHQRCFHQF